MTDQSPCPNRDPRVPHTFIVRLGDADPALDGLLECACGCVFTAARAPEGGPEAYRHPRLGIDFFWSRALQKHVSLPGVSLL